MPILISAAVIYFVCVEENISMIEEKKIQEKAHIFHYSEHTEQREHCPLPEG